MESLIGHFFHSVFCYYQLYHYWLLINAATRKYASIISLTYLYCWCEVSNDVSWRQYQIEWLKGGITLQYRDSIPPPPLSAFCCLFIFFTCQIYLNITFQIHSVCLRIEYQYFDLYMCVYTRLTLIQCNNQMIDQTLDTNKTKWPKRYRNVLKYIMTNSIIKDIQRRL